MANPVAGLRVVLTPHTVTTPGGVVAGMLVRDAGSQRELGYVWAAGSVQENSPSRTYRWRTPDGANFGERASMRAAVQVLRDAYDLRRGTVSGAAAPVPDRDILAAWRSASTQAPRPAPTPKPTTPKPPTPTPPRRSITWTDQSVDLTRAIAAALEKQK
jgi:hypothetical protein